jgi:hypothetical protein
MLTREIDMNPHGRRQARRLLYWTSSRCAGAKAMPLSPVVEELVERFALNQEAYRTGQYNEAQVRQEFINLTEDEIAIGEGERP